MKITRRNMLISAGLASAAAIPVVRAQNHEGHDMSKMPGMEKASVNLATETATLAYDPAVLRLSEIKDKIRSLGYEPLEARKTSQALEQRARKEKELRVMWRKLIVAAVFALPLLFMLVCLGGVAWIFKTGYRLKS